MIHQVVVERLRVLEYGTALNRSIVLTGYLGNRPEIRLTRERDITVTWENPVAETTESYEVRTRAREFMVIPLYTHYNRQTQRHRLVVWLRIPTKPATQSDGRRPPCRSVATSRAHG
jgi:hypothetical protein